MVFGCYATLKPEEFRTGRGGEERRHIRGKMCVPLVLSHGDLCLSSHEAEC